MKHSAFYHLLRNNLGLMADFIRRMAQVLHLLHQAGIVHADLKPDNILIAFDEEAQAITSLKVIDLGSSFLLNREADKLKDQIEFGQSTPEYLPPEVQILITQKFTQPG